MDSAGILFGLLCVGMLSAISNGQVSKEVSTEDVGPQNSAVSAERDLVRETVSSNCYFLFLVHSLRKLISIFIDRLNKV